MNKFRSAILGGNAAGAAAPLIASKQPGKAAGEDLTSVGIPRDAVRSGDHRDDDRHRLSQETATVRFDGKDHLVELINLSGGGAMIATTLKPRLWDRMDLFLGEGSPLECAVRWIREDRIGLEFAHETRIECAPEQRDALLLEVIRRSFPDLAAKPVVEAPLAPEAPAPAPAEPTRRGDQRHPLIWNGEILWNHDVHPVRLRNISASGVLVDCSVVIPEGAELMLDLGDNGQYFATVGWSRNGQAGLVFARPFDLSVLAAVRPQVATGWTRPDFLAAKANKDSPWASEWDRCSVEDLRTQLEGFLKR